MSDVARRSETKVKRKREGLMREVMTALLVMNLSQSKEVKRTKPAKKLPRVRRCSSSIPRRGNKHIAVVIGEDKVSSAAGELFSPLVDNFYPRRLLGGVVSTLVIFTRDLLRKKTAAV